MTAHAAHTNGFKLPEIPTQSSGKHHASETEVTPVATIHTTIGPATVPLSVAPATKHVASKPKWGVHADGTSMMEQALDKDWSTTEHSSDHFWYKIGAALVIIIGLLAIGAYLAHTNPAQTAFIFDAIRGFVAGL